MSTTRLDPVWILPIITVSHESYLPAPSEDIGKPSRYDVAATTATSGNVRSRRCVYWRRSGSFAASKPKTSGLRRRPLVLERVATRRSSAHDTQAGAGLTEG